MRLLSSADVAAAVPMDRAIQVARQALEELSAGEITAPLRPPLQLPEGAVTLVMPGHRPSTRDLAVKVVSVHPRNAARGLPTVHAVVVVVDAATGLPTGLVEGNALTALRTGAAVGAATDLLARPDARILAVFGAGVQARAALRAVCAVRPIAEVRLISRSGRSAERWAAELQQCLPASPLRVIVAASPSEAVRGADILVTATTSTVPVFSGDDVGPGVHVNALGAFRPADRELDEETVTRARIVVDTREGCLAEAGDLLIPLAAGRLDAARIAELGEVSLGRRPGRTSPDQVTLYKSVGHAALDVAMAGEAIRRAASLGLGQVIED